MSGGMNAVPFVFHTATTLGRYVRNTNCIAAERSLLTWMREHIPLGNHVYFRGVASDFECVCQNTRNWAPKYAILLEASGGMLPQDKFESYDVIDALWRIYMYVLDVQRYEFNWIFCRMYVTSRLKTQLFVIPPHTHTLTHLHILLHLLGFRFCIRCDNL